MIVRKKYTRDHYEKVKKLILKVKTIYLQRKAEKLKEDKENKENQNKSYLMDDDDEPVHKSQSAGDKDKDAIHDVITDEDLVPLDLLD